MSTRCQVRIESKDGNQEVMMLYHHCDGYPSNIIPLIVKAFEAGQELSNGGYELCNPGKVASLLCHVDPLQFEPLMHYDLHFDIAYFYKIVLERDQDGDPEWKVAVLRIGRGESKLMTLTEAVEWTKTQK
jgi:hypothetical protein